ncbi:MAG: hypothetical protein JSU94_20950, partial [Phycisphaerales bacterium]
DKGDGYGTSEDHIFNYLCDGAAIATCTYPHFWDYDGDNGLSGAGADDIVVVASDNWPNAWMKVSGYRVSQFGNPPRSPEGYGLWQEALLNYRLYGFWNAYERLGHICHLLADMSVPAHVHEDLHPSSDHYEDTISANITAVLTYLDREEFNRGMIPIPGHLSAGFDPEMFPLFYLMYTTNQRADFFASEDDWGDALDWLGWVDYSTWPGAYSYYQDPDHVLTPVWTCYICGALQCIGEQACAGTFCVDCYNRGLGFQPLYGSHPQWIIAERITLVYAVRASATLWELFLNQVQGRIQNARTLATYTTIQGAISSASDGDTILVKPGTYYEGIRFYGKAITLRSTDGPQVTTINANGLVHAVQCVDREDSDTILEGFTVTGGHANGPSYPDNCGGGMFNNRSSPTVINCNFTANNAAGKGGGIYNHVYNEQSGRSPRIVNCVFSGNTAGAGGGVCNDWHVSTKTTNCIFGRNSAGQTGGAICNVNNSTPVVTSCILRDNSAPSGAQIYDDATSAAVVVCSNVHGGAPGAGNIDADPCFVDADGADNIHGTPDDNLRLSPGSPCIDSGDNSTPDLPARDRDGLPRTIDGDCNGVAVVDMGVYEFNHAWMGDFNHNCRVEFGDYSVLAAVWLSEHTDELWDPLLNLGGPADARIDWRDLAVIAEHWLSGE